MRNNIGIMNSRSYLQEYVRDLRRPVVKTTIRLTVTQEDIEYQKSFVKGQLSVAKYHGIEVRIRELQAQLKLLGEWRPV